MNTTSSLTMDDVTQQYYDARIRHVAEPNLPHRLLGVPGQIPAGMGSTVIYPRMGAKPTVKTTLVEGVTPAPGSASLDKVTGTTDQIGYYEIHSDLLELTIDSSFMQAQNTAMGYQAARSIDWRTSQDLALGTSVLRVNNRATRGDIVSGDVLAMGVVKLAGTTLANANAMRYTELGNRWVGLIHPNVKHDLTADPLWTDQVKNNPNPQAQEQFRGFYIGDAFGITWVESTETKVYEGAGSGGINVYATQIIAQGFYGWHSLQDLSFIAKQRGSGGVNDALDQRSSTGWKTAFGTTIIFDQYGLRIESASSLG